MLTLLHSANQSHDCYNQIIMAVAHLEASILHWSIDCNRVFTKAQLDEMKDHTVCVTSHTGCINAGKSWRSVSSPGDRWSHEKGSPHENARPLLDV